MVGRRCPANPEAQESCPAGLGDAPPVLTRLPVMTNDCSAPLSVWAISDCESAADALRQALREAGIACAGERSCLSLGQDFDDRAPEAIIFHLHGDAQALLEALRVRQGHLSCPVCVIAANVDADVVRALVEAGVHHWADRLHSSALCATLGFASAQFQRLRGLGQVVTQMRTQLDERKWVDRAKGLLMTARGIAEDEAFALLRSGAMHANLKLADLARSVVDAAQWAEAVNRSGQLRMLSQRAVSAAAQRLARVDTAGARKVQQQALDRARDNLAHLGRLPLLAHERAALEGTTTAWQKLSDALGVRLELTSLQAADAAALMALQAAEALTAAVEAQGARKALYVVNLCGRQRMHAQRLVKEGLLAVLGVAPNAADLAQEIVQAFSDGLAEIESLPLDSPEIRQALAASQEGWLQMLRALRSADPAALVHAGQHLLDQVENLTLQCERSLQMLMA
jgi:AmiR/NasT family two-component response regulator